MKMMKNASKNPRNIAKKLDMTNFYPTKSLPIHLTKKDTRSFRMYLFFKIPSNCESKVPLLQILISETHHRSSSSC